MALQCIPRKRITIQAEVPNVCVIVKVWKRMQSRLWVVGLYRHRPGGCGRAELSLNYCRSIIFGVLQCSQADASHVALLAAQMMRTVGVEEVQRRSRAKALLVQVIRHTVDTGQGHTHAHANANAHAHAHAPVNHVRLTQFLSNLSNV